MSEAMKKRHTNDEMISIQFGKKKSLLYVVPKRISKAIGDLLNEYQLEDSSPWREAMAEKFKETSEQAAKLRGARAKENMAQKELADKLEVTQGYISQIEKGDREITKPLAKKLSKIFGTNYKVFL